MHILFPYDGYEHLGIGYLAAVAQRKGHTVDLLRLPIGDYIRGYRPFDNRAMGRTVAAIIEKKPDIVAFSLNSFQADAFIRLAKALRDCTIRTIAGGPHATAEPELTLETGAFDGLIAGEAEAVFCEAIEYIVSGRGECPPWLHTGMRSAVMRAPLPDIHTLPPPAKELFYRHAGFEAEDYKVIASRGCPYHCTFCSHTPIPGEPPYRKRRPDDIIEELKRAREMFAPSTVYFLDDVFTLDREWLASLMEAYRVQVGIPFHAITHPVHFNLEIAGLLRSAGCFALRLGIQSVTPAVKQRLGREEENVQVADAIAAARRCGIRVEVDHMVNLPGESFEEGRQGVLFYNDHRPDTIKVYWLTPLPGTKLLSQLQVEGKISVEEAMDIRRGRGLGRHSYLFDSGRAYSDPRWTGIHFLLVLLPFLPGWLVRALVFIKADRVLRFLPFVVVVGFSRFLNVIRGGDRVGLAHMKRMLAGFWGRL
jgi:anaerobic magnesium-protoporphyrin IX monomethyl ester cyclase